MKTDKILVSKIYTTAIGKTIAIRRFYGTRHRIKSYNYNNNNRFGNRIWIINVIVLKIEMIKLAEINSLTLKRTIITESIPSIFDLI